MEENALIKLVDSLLRIRAIMKHLNMRTLSSSLPVGIEVESLPVEVRISYILALEGERSKTPGEIRRPLRYLRSNLHTGLRRELGIILVVTVVLCTL